MNIAVIGTGYVGLVTGACFAEFGVKVTCVDKDAARIQALRSGRVPFYEPGLAERVAKNAKEGRLLFTEEIGPAVEAALVAFIAVGTPPRGDGSADLSYVEEVGRAIAGHLNGYKVIVMKSTVPVGTGDRLRKIIGEHLKEHVHFDIASNPEFLREGSAIEDFMRPNRVIIGADSPQAVAILKDLYRPLYLLDTPFVVTDIPTAEMIKYASNAFLATKISFINEIANLCERIGADVKMVAKGMGLDGRIGSKFLHAGPGYGGSCLPKDTNALVRLARSHGEGHRLEVVEAAIRANDKQQVRMIEKITEAVGSVEGKTIGMLGLAFKPNTDDLRDAVSIRIIEDLQKRGARFRAYDPAAMESAKKLLPKVVYCEDPYQTAEGADGLVLVTEWNQFRNLDLDRVRKALRQPVFIDLRNVYEPARMKESGFRFVCVGRGGSSA
jgi:UDPglucose 6-dehydrogenase